MNHFDAVQSDSDNTLKTPTSANITSSPPLSLTVLLENALEVVYSPRNNTSSVAFTKDGRRDWMPIKVIRDNPDSDEED